MKRFLSLLLCLVLLTPAAALAATEEYTVAGKLARQLWAGSGFSATLTLDVTDQAGASVLQKPVQMNVDYIYVRPNEEEAGEHRADVTLMDGDNAASAAHVQVKGGNLALQADFISPDWYSFAKQDPQSQTQLDQAAEGWLELTGAPGLTATVLKALVNLQTSDALDEVIDAYTTRIDLWMEGYRQETVLDKLEDGTTTMQVSYQVPAQAIKAQVKQMVLDLLSDQTSLEALANAFGQELPLNAKLQNYYFQAVDDLPLTGDLTLSRTVSLQNETLALHLSLPLYDAKGGAVTLSYDRTQGQGDLPDDNQITLESDLRSIQLAYQEYASMTDVQVVRGTLHSQTKGQTDALPLAVAFTLRQQQAESTDEQNQDVYTYTADLTLSQDGQDTLPVPAMEIALETRFVSKPQKSAATEVTGKLTVGGDGLDNAYALSFQGSSRKKWEPEALPGEITYVQEMSQEELSALLPGAAARGLALLSAYLPASTETPAPEQDGQNP